MISILAIVIIAMVLIIPTIIVIIGIFVKPKPKQIVFPSMNGIDAKKDCSREPVTCHTDDNCSHNSPTSYCEDDGRDYTCAPAESGSPTESGKKICKPERAQDTCNTKFGDPVWAGWSGVEEMGWDCFCTNPNIAASTDCNLNNDICRGSLNPANPTNCNCNENETKYKRSNKTEFCAPNTIPSVWYTNDDDDKNITVDYTKYCKKISGHCECKGLPDPSTTEEITNCRNFCEKETKCPVS